MKDFCVVANQNCKQPAGWGGDYGYAENIGPLADIPACYRCGEPVCASCGKPWLVFWFCPGCLKEQQAELQATVERMKVLGLFNDQ